MSKKSFFALVVSGSNKVIHKLDIAPTPHQNLYNEFLSQHNNFVSFETNKKEIVDFVTNAQYKPENHELLEINHFDDDIAKSILLSVEQPEAFTSINIQEDIGNIKAIYTYIESDNKFTILMQYFDKGRVLKRNKLTLQAFFQEKHTFNSLENNVITLSSYLSSVIVSDNDSVRLQFISAWQAKQIFDCLYDYMEEASKNDVLLFTQHRLFHSDNTFDYYTITRTQKTKKKIKFILRGEILSKWTVDKIKHSYSEKGLSINITDNKIEIPKTQKELDRLIDILNSDMYISPHGEMLLSNSKRIIEN